MKGIKEGSIKLKETVKTALIMAAGYGTRLEPLTLAVPKPMVPIVNKPTMQHNLELLRFNGIRHAIANIHYHPEQIVNYFSDGLDFGVDLSYSYEETLLGTAGGVWRMGRVVDKIDETFLVLSSDALTDINIRKLLKFHRQKKSLATLALYPVEEVDHFGVVEIDPDQKIIGFQEKPKESEAKSKLANAGIYLFEPEIFEMIPKDKFYDFGKNLFPMLVEKKLPIYGYQMIEHWSDVGTIAAYIKANQDVMGGLVRLIIPGEKKSSHVWVGKNPIIHPSVTFDGNVVVGDRCEIKEGSVIKDSVVGNMCVIGKESNLNGSIIWSDTFISKNVVVNGSVIGNWCKIEQGSKINQNSVISNRCQVKKDTTVPEGTTLKPLEIL